MQVESERNQVGALPSKDAVSSPVEHAAKSLLKRTRALPKTSMMKRLLPQNSSIWKTPPIWSRCATIGTIAFPGSSVTASSEERVLNLDTQNPFFIDNTPGMLQLLSVLPAKTQDPTLRKDTLSFRLIPSPMQNDPALFPRLPEVFVEYDVNSLADSQPVAALNKVLMLYLHDETQIMQPKRVADLRYTEQAILQCAAKDYAKDLSPDLDSWIDETKQSILGGGRIRPRSTVHINLPHQLVSKLASKPQPKARKPLSERDKRLEAERTARITYLFAGVEHRELVPFQSSEFELVYTSREGGKMGGRGGSLSLQQSSKDDRTGSLSAKVQSQRARFITAAFEVLRMVDDAVKGTLVPGPAQPPRQRV